MAKKLKWLSTFQTDDVIDLNRLLPAEFMHRLPHVKFLYCCTAKSGRLSPSLMAALAPAVIG